MKIVVGYLPTPAGRAALRTAVEEATLRSAELVVVQAHHTRRWARHTNAQETEAALSEDRAALDASGVGYELVPVADDADPADVILGACERTHTQLLVIGTRRRTPVGKLIMAPTTQRLLLEAACPVLCVKASYGTD
ncbi:universal stress protein UspA [Kocuria varians]|uniref:Universal stress protein UspA n=1 Tax=Kocuria varians TaxID=1272 RepID=A0A4Y4D910_KOCVA|nr:universal stress protein [Kocuria varians]GED00215.1 universal stress protein UspA [Kocuria varians]